MASNLTYLSVEISLVLWLVLLAFTDYPIEVAAVIALIVPLLIPITIFVVLYLFVKIRSLLKGNKK